MTSLLVRLKFNINKSQGVKPRLAIQKGQTVSIFYRKNQTIIYQTSSQSRSTVLPWVPAHDTSGQYYCSEFPSLLLGGSYYCYKSRYLSLDVSTLPWDNVLVSINTLFTIRAQLLSRAQVPRCQYTILKLSACHKMSEHFSEP